MQCCVLSRNFLEAGKAGASIRKRLRARVSASKSPFGIAGIVTRGKGMRIWQAAAACRERAGHHVQVLRRRMRRLLVQDAGPAACGSGYLTTVTPMDLAVPMMELQMDSKGTNSLPGSDCFTCARRKHTLRERASRSRMRALAISYTCFSEIEPRGACPGFWLPDKMPDTHHRQRRHACASYAALINAPAAFLMKYVAGGFFTTCKRFRIVRRVQGPGG